MSAKGKLSRLMNDPVGVVTRRINALWQLWRYVDGTDYRAVEYWSRSHGKYGFDLRGVGDYGLTPEENLRQLEEGGRLMIELCRRANFDLRRASVLDVGCGTGYYAGILRDAGVSRYTGVDIVDTLFSGLRAQCPDFTFRRLDVSSEPITGSYQLIIMMDVAQHIVEARRFRYAMENLKGHLAEDGMIIISTCIGPYRRNTFYCVDRPMSAFEVLFGGYRISDPLPFFTNKMFSIQQQ